MIDTIDRSPNDPIYKRTGDASYFMAMEITETKRIVKSFGYTDRTVTSKMKLVEPLPLLLWADTGQTLRLTEAIASGEDPTVSANQYPNSPALNTFVEALLLTAIFEKTIIPKSPGEIATRGLYFDLRDADLLAEFDIDNMARFLAGLGVLENSVSLNDGTDVQLTKIGIPDFPIQPTIKQLNILTLQPLWDLIESLAFQGILPYCYIYGLFDFKEFCYRVGRYWPTQAEREYFVFNELPAVLLAKRAPSLSEEQVDALINEPII